MKVYTKLAFAGQTLHLPILGDVTLDKEAAIEVKDEKTANWLIDVTKGSNSFHKTKEEANMNTKKQSIAVTNETVKIKTPRQRLGEVLQEVGVTQVRQWIDEVFPQTSKVDAEKLTPVTPAIEEKKEDDTKTQEVEETTSNEEEIANAEDLVEAINSCENKEELLSLIELIPGVKKKDTKGKETDELKQFLIGHINSVTKK
jgi:hypothetical protein